MPHTLEKDIFTKSYFVLQDEITKANPGLSGHDLRVQIAEQFRPRYRLDMEAFHHEIAGTGEYKVQDVMITDDGDIYYPKYNTTAEKLNENTRLHNPKEYSIADHQASRLAAKTLAHGASTVAMVYAREGSDNRDIQIFKIDPITKRGQTTMINAASDGKLHTFFEMQGIMQRMFPELTQVKPEEKISVFTDRPLSVVTARRITASVRQQQQKETKVKVQPNTNVILVSEARAHPGSDRDSGQARMTAHNPERLTLEKIREKPIAIADVIEKRHREMTETKHALLVVAKTCVGIGAVPFLIGSLAKELPKPMVAVEKSIARHEKKKRRSLSLASRLARREHKAHKFLTRLNQTRKIEDISFPVKLKIKSKEKRKWKRKGKAQDKLWLMSTVGKIIQSHSERISIDSRRSLSRTLMRDGNDRLRERTLVHVLIKLAHKVKKFEQSPIKPMKNELKIAESAARKKTEFTVSKKEKQHREKKEAIVKFSFALTLWFFMSSPVKNGTSSKDWIPPGGMTKDKEAFIQKEPVPWILLSIIWYLAMIRESGGHNAPKAKVKKKKKNYQSVQLIDLPPAGIIFAWGSGERVPLTAVRQLADEEGELGGVRTK